MAETFVFSSEPFRRFAPYAPGESWDSMRDRFDAAIAEPMSGGDDQRSIDAKHVFDFCGGYRLHVTREHVKEFPTPNFLLVTFAIVHGEALLPAELLMCKAALHFAELTGNRYGNPEVVHVQPGMVMLAYPLEQG